MEHILINLWRFSLRVFSNEDCVFSGLKKLFCLFINFKFVVEWIPAIRNHVQSKISLTVLHLLMNNEAQFACLWCCVPPDFVLSLVLFSAVIHKRRGMKLTSKIIKYKLDSFSKMQFVFFYPKHIQEFCQQSGNDANCRRREGGGGGGRGVWGEAALFFASIWSNAYENRYVIHP